MPRHIDTPTLHPTRPLEVGYALPETELRRGPEVARWTELRALTERPRAYGQAGISHVIVDLDPDTGEGITAFAPVLALLDGR